MGIVLWQYYVYICDLTENVEHYRTPLQTLLDLESQIRGTIAGFNMPQFIVDLPGGGGKRLGSTYESYNRKTGVSRFIAPAVTATASDHGGRDKPEVFEYYDPINDDATNHGAGAKVQD
jgi:lysine 2,3-aminomutase